MTAFNIDFDACPVELRDGLQEIIAHRIDRFGDGILLSFIPGNEGFAITAIDDEVTISYGTKSDAFRALGCILGGTTAAEQTSSFNMLGAMIDVSRNGVLTVPAAKHFLRCCALMGLNMIMLYSEDTYEVPGEPFFGYLRGRYSQAELKELDDYAFNLGIEMIPCIQTLAHLEQILQWPVYEERRDTGGILVAEEDETYELVKKLVTAATAPFRTRRIHLGMDEAWGLGSGEFKKRHGEKSGFEIMNTHLARVKAICAELGVTPMIWGDMYIHLASATGNIYDYSSKIPQEVINKIPTGVDLVYWDYYHTTTSDYEQGIDLYNQLGAPLLMAGGGWTWNHLWAHLPYAFAATNACMTACKSKGVKDYFITLWGDDGMECDVFSALPALQLVAEHAYADKVCSKALASNFLGACDGDIEAFFTASKIDYLADRHDGTKGPDNMCKWLLWQDPLLSITDPNIDTDLRSYYTNIAEKLEMAMAEPGLNQRLLFPAAIARALSLKVNLRHDLHNAYIAGDKATLRTLLNTDVADTCVAIDKLWRIHRDVWMNTYTPFGWEVIELRYGGIRTRLTTMKERLEDYLCGKLDSIPELEVELLKIWDTELEHVSPHRGRVQTPSCIK
ncbi:MAG: beta-N-acetylhexosaminidase [bacterium]